MSSLRIYLSGPAGSPASGPPWSSVHVPPSAHEIKPFLAFLRRELKVSEEYGFKLSTSTEKQSVSDSTRSPLTDASLKPITNPTEFKALFDQLEWSDGGDLTLVVELKRKDPAAIAAAAAAANAPKANAPAAKTPAYVPVQAHSASSPSAAVSLGAVGANGKVVGERDPNYFNNGAVAAAAIPTPVPAPSYASQNRFNQSAAPSASSSSTPTKSVSDRLAMFGGATSVVARKIESETTTATTSAPPANKFQMSAPPVAAPAPVLPATPFQPTPAAAVTVVPLPTPPVVVPAQPMTFAQPMSFATVQPVVSVVRSQPFQPQAQQVTVIPLSFSSSTGASTIGGLDTSTSFLRISDPNPMPQAAPAPIMISGANRASLVDDDLPAAPQGFVDPFAVGGSTASVHPPLPSIPTGSSSHPALPTPPVQGGGGGPTFQVAKVYTLGGPTGGDPSIPAGLFGSLGPTTQVASVQTFDRPEVKVAQLSAFLAELKPNTAKLALLYATDQFGEMVQVCTRQVALYHAEVASGLLAANSVELNQASNGLLLYLFYLSLAQTALQQFASALASADAFQREFASLPALLQGEPANSSMLVQLLYNSGLALERQGDPHGAIRQLTKAAEQMDKCTGAGGDGTSAAGASSTSSLPSSYDHRSSILSALGNLTTGLKDFPAGQRWHQLAMASEDTRSPLAARHWSIYHAAASCFAQSGDFARSIEFDSRALEVAAAAGPTGGPAGKLHPRVYFNRGLARQRTADWQGSVEDMTKVIDLDGAGHPKAYTLRAKARLKETPEPQWQLVANDCQTTLKLAPTDTQARELLQFAQQQLQ